jgi:hypothetical protein
MATADGRRATTSPAARLASRKPIDQNTPKGCFFTPGDAKLPVRCASTLRLSHFGQTAFSSRWDMLHVISKISSHSLHLKS